jgi:hypothetical protein
MAKAKIVQALPEHIPVIAASVREDDRREFAALWTTPERAMRSGLANSPAVWTGLVDDIPLAMFGVAPAGFLTPETGRPWMIGTGRLDEHALLFLRRCRPQVARMLEHFPELINYVATFNYGAIAWLKWLGFQFAPQPVLLGKGVPFYRFELRRSA